MKKIGFIGLGIMGLPMATNLVKKSNCEVLGFDVVETSKAKFAQAGGTAVDTTKTIFESCETIFICLPKNELVESTVKDIIANCKQGTTIIDLSSTAPAVIRNLYPQALEAGMALLDSPVSGGEPGAIAGTLVIMCGGEIQIFKQAKPLLDCMGSRVTFLGGPGNGDVAKLANNMIVGANLIAVSEAFAFAAKAGLDPEVLFLAIKDGFAQNAVMDAKVPKMISRDFTPSARIAVHQKDMKNALQFAGEMGVEIPMSSIVLDYMNRMEEEGLINEDQCALVKMFEKDMGVEVK